jgi:hypothetical protein
MSVYMTPGFKPKNLIILPMMTEQEAVKEREKQARVGAENEILLQERINEVLSDRDFIEDSITFVLDWRTRNIQQGTPSNLADTRALEYFLKQFNLI